MKTVEIGQSERPELNAPPRRKMSAELLARMGGGEARMNLENIPPDEAHEDRSPQPSLVDRDRLASLRNDLLKRPGTFNNRISPAKPPPDDAPVLQVSFSGYNVVIAESVNMLAGDISLLCKIQGVQNCYL